MRTLVVYCSRTGTTREVASAIAQAIGADLEEITDRTPRGGLVGFLRSGFESISEREAPIGPAKRDPRDYDLVIVGTPVWVGNVSSPVRAYLSRVRGLAGKVALFCTMGGSGSARALRNMEALSGARPVARLALRTGVGFVEGQAAIRAFVAAAKAAVAPAARAPARKEGPAVQEARVP